MKMNFAKSNSHVIPKKTAITLAFFVTGQEKQYLR